MTQRTLQQRQVVQPLDARGVDVGAGVAGPYQKRLEDVSATLNGSPAVQRIAAMAPVNRTGLPDTLKAGIEGLSGLSMDAVRVHRNSAKPAQLNAHAYAQGTEIHLAPGADRHLPHEAWHVVQQAQGRVKPTMQLRSSTPVNDDPALEREADTMGLRAMTGVGRRSSPAQFGVGMIVNDPKAVALPGRSAVQGVFVTAGLDGSGKALEAFKIFSASIPDKSASKYVQDADHIVVEFEVAKALDGAQGDTNKTVELFDDFTASFETAGGKLGGGPEKIKGKKTFVTIRLDGNFVTTHSPAIIAKTLAHELGAHVAPYAEIFRKAYSQEGLAEEDINFMTKRGHSKGAGDHAAIRERKETEYENIVIEMAKMLGGPKNKDAQDVVYYYLCDIARYDKKGEPIEDQGAITKQARYLLTDGGMGWAAPYIHNRAPVKQSSSVASNLVLGLSVLVGLVGLYLGYHRWFASGAQ